MYDKAIRSEAITIRFTVGMLFDFQSCIFVLDNIKVKVYLHINFAIRPCIPEVISGSQS